MRVFGPAPGPCAETLEDLFGALSGGRSIPELGGVEGIGDSAAQRGRPLDAPGLEIGRHHLLEDGFHLHWVHGGRLEARLFHGQAHRPARLQPIQPRGALDLLADPAEDR